MPCRKCSDDGTPCNLDPYTCQFSGMTREVVQVQADVDFWTQLRTGGY